MQYHIVGFCAAIALTGVSGMSALAQSTPAYVTAAVNDPNRPDWRSKLIYTACRPRAWHSPG